MDRIASFEDTPGLKDLLSAHYPAVRAERIRAHRDWIGHVYIVEGAGARYVLKLYRPFHERQALDSVPILRYLAAQDYPATRIVDTQAGEAFIRVQTPGGVSVAILYAYIEGEPVEDTEDLAAIAEQTARLHDLMDRYEGPLPAHGKGYFIDRYTEMLGRIGFPGTMLADLQDYGAVLWARLMRAAPGFCHGDLHTGNMIRSTDGRIWLIDFDAASHAYPVVDIATMSDATDYFTCREADLEETARKLERFLAGYTKHRAVSECDMRSVYDCIAIRHYDIQATITDCQGYSMDNLMRQHAWLMAWRELCDRRI